MLTNRTRFLLWTLATVLAVGGLAAWEYHAFGWHLFREEPAGFLAYHWFRLALASGLTLALVISLAASSWTDPGPRSAPMLRVEGALAALVMLGALLLALLLIESPLAYAALTAEDGAVENVSAALLFLGAGAFAAQGLRHLRANRGRAGLHVRIEQLILAGLTLVLFMIGGEEISWGQRVIHFATPEMLASHNWQREFNLHNVQTDVSETIYYVGAGLFLALVPLARDRIADWGVLNVFRSFAPSRSAVAVAAPIAIFNYGHWNLMPIQIATLAVPLVCLAYSSMAAREGLRAEKWLFRALAIAVMLGLSIHLVRGSSMGEAYDATEYKELFIAIGLAWYAVDLPLARWREARAGRSRAGRERPAQDQTV